MVEFLAGAGSAYLLIAALVAGDGIFPSVPGETALIGGAILAADGDLSLAGVMAAGIVGGLIGDNCSYLIGARAGRPAASRFFKSERSKRRLEWAREQLDERGASIIITARFIPVGRTATTFASGMLAMPWRSFFAADAIAVLAWALYACLAGYFGGRALGLDGPAVLIGAILFATVMGLTVEGVRRLVNLVRSRSDQPGPAEPERPL